MSSVFGTRLSGELGTAVLDYAAANKISKSRVVHLAVAGFFKMPAPPRKVARRRTRARERVMAQVL